MITDKAIENLNTLLCINNDRVEGYKSAIYEAKEVNIKIMFSTLAQTSLQCRKELIQELKKLGGKRNNGFRETGKFFNVWREMKKAIKKDDHQTILYSCKHGENAVLREYLKIIKGSFSDLNLECESVLYRQYNLLKADYEKINQLHNYFQEEKV